MKDSEIEKHEICQENNFKVFFNTHAKLLRNFLYYKYGGLNEVDDIVQDSFIKLWNNCNKVTIKTAKSYLYRIAINDSNSLLRHEKVKLKHQKEIKNINQNSTIQSPEYILEEKEFKNKLDNAISSLPNRQREVFLLNRIDKKNIFVKLQNYLMFSVKAIEKLMHKALLKLRLEIENIP